MIKDITFVTAYSTNLYNLSGHRLVQSWQSNKSGKLITYSEDGAKADYVIDRSTLDWFIKQFKKYVPIYYGGDSVPCDCATIIRGKVKHTLGCHWSLWNRNAYRWFHKVVAISQAAEIVDTKYLIWVDCDCIFLAPLKFSFLDPHVKNRDLAYLKGSKREAIESGLLVFNLERFGKQVIEAWMNRYQKEQFLSDHRWDDGFQITRVVQATHENSPNYSYMDMAKTCTNQDPAKECLLSGYLYHYKGMHGRRGLGIPDTNSA